MPHDRAGRTYLSEFTAPTTSLTVGSIHRAKSNEQLARNSYWKTRQPKLSLGYFTQSIKKAKSTQDLRKEERRSAKLTASHAASTAETSDPTLRLEFERELEEHLQNLLRKERYNAVTVPSSVKFSVTGEAPNRLPQLTISDCSDTMSRPRSPKGKEPHQLEGLDQLLHNIRQQLNQLSDERTQMELRMDDVVNGIQQAQTQYQNQIRNLYQSKKQSSKRSPPTPGSLRRVHSSDPKYTHSTRLIPRTSETSLDLPDGAPSPNQKETRVLTFDESTPHFSEEAADDSAYGGSCSTYKGPRNDSLSSSDSRSRSSSLNIGGSLSQSNEVFGSWLSPTNTIPELPESPRLMGATPPSSLSQDSFMQSMPSLHYHSQATPTRHNHMISPMYRQHRSYSTSTPKNHAVKDTSIPEASRLEPSSKATSSPDVSRRGVSTKSDHTHHHQHPAIRVTQRTSLSDNVINSVIVEDKVDNQSFTDSLSQLSTCTDDGSPKTAGSTIIIRRSSLTGQLEHVRKPRSASAVKRNSSFDVSKEHSTKFNVARQRAASMCVMNQTLPKEFKVLNRGVRCRRKRKPVILNTSVETTV